MSECSACSVFRCSTSEEVFFLIETKQKKTTITTTNFYLIIRCLFCVYQSDILGCSWCFKLIYTRSHKCLCLPVYNMFQSMAASHSGPTGLSAASPVVVDISVAPVHAPIPRRRTVAKAAGDWEELSKHRYVTQKTA